MPNIEQREKNRDLAPRLNRDWGVGAKQARYRDTGDFYATLARFPAALFDRNGFLLFKTEEEYRSCSHIQFYPKLINIRNGICTVPGYVTVAKLDLPPQSDVDIHDIVVTEGTRRLVIHLRLERDQRIVRLKKKRAASLDCEVCGFSFTRTYGPDAQDYCEVHHLSQLSDVANSARTRMKDLAIVCANCHRVIHLNNPPYSLDQVKEMLRNTSKS